MGLTFNVTYDESVKSAPAGYRIAVDSALKFLSHAFTDPITINLAVSFGEVAGTPIEDHFVAQSYRHPAEVTYDQITSALRKHVSSVDDVTAFLSLPRSDPTNTGTSTGIWAVTAAQAKALGIDTGQSGLDGEFGLSADLTYTYDPDNRLMVNGYDAIGIIIHEVTEIMGRWQYSGVQNPEDPSERGYAPLDLYRYSAPGARALTPGEGYFSLDGQSLLQRFDDSTGPFDAVDWDIDTVFGDSFGASEPGVINAVTALDLRVMDVAGYHRAPSPHSDLNGDAVSDVLWRDAATGTVGYWAMNGGVATWQDLGQASRDWKIVGTGDFNGDFAQDIAWYNTDTADVGSWDLPSGGGAPLWTHLGNGGPGWDVVGTGDINGDGRTDIVWHNASTGDVGYWAMGSTTPAWHDIGGSVLSYQVEGVGDFDGNGRADILWRDQNSGDTGVFLLNAKGQPTWLDYGPISFVDQIAGTGDFDGNGTTDILWRNKADGTTGYWAMDTSAHGAWQGLGAAPLDFTVLAVGDYNGDGSSDILWRDSAGATGYWAIHEGQPSWHGLGDSSATCTVAA